jgi:hypothetical protein
MPRHYLNIHGHFNFEQVYHDQVTNAPHSDVHFLEIGCYLGKSTVFLAECIKESGKSITLHVIDTFEGEGMSVNEDNLYQKFIANINNANVADVIKVYNRKSDDAVTLFNDNFFDFIYIDGLHTYDAVTSDIVNYLPKLKLGHVLAGHDYQSMAVQSAVNDNLGYDNLLFHQNTWLFKNTQT